MSGRDLAREASRIGALALPVAALGAGGAGAAAIALAADPAAVLAHFARRAPAVVAPLAALLFVAAPVGARIAGDLRAAREGGQLDWLLAAGHSPWRLLVAPRIGAALLLLALAALVAGAALLAAAWLVAPDRELAAASFAVLDPAAFARGAVAAGIGGAALAAAAAAAGLAVGDAGGATRSRVATAAARGAAAALAAATAFGVGWLAWAS
jgi:hypothetical protein